MRTKSDVTTYNTQPINNQNQDLVQQNLYEKVYKKLGNKAKNSNINGPLRSAKKINASIKKKKQNEFINLADSKDDELYRYDSLNLHSNKSIVDQDMLPYNS